MTTFLAFLLFLSLFYQVTLQNEHSSMITDHDSHWKLSNHLDKWFSPFDVCLVNDERNITSEQIIKDCEEKVTKNNPSMELPPMRCRIGNTWPSRSTFCDASDIPFSKRRNFRTVYEGFDNPQDHVLKEFFQALIKKKGMLLLIGDSVMQQFFSAIACELEREHVWTDPKKFTNTDETQYVFQDQIDPKIHKNEANLNAAIKFLPIYHFVDGRYDRRPQAAFHLLTETLKQLLAEYKTIIILCNMGLHYIDNPAPGFSRSDYSLQMEKLLLYFHSYYQEHHHSHEIKIIWRETTAQHFMTPNGYWPGIKYIRNMELKCSALQDTSLASDWRNREIEKIIMKHSLSSSIRILRFYNTTIPLWSEHPNGHLKDCTHFCWTPMLYQPAFHYLRDLLVSSKTSNHHH
jgi:hypothetical protein